MRPMGGQHAAVRFLSFPQAGTSISKQRKSRSGEQEKSVSWDHCLSSLSKPCDAKC